MTKKFHITGGKGFQVRFENGCGISVQFGQGNYCQHYGKLGSLMKFEENERKCGEEGSDTAEIAVAYDGPEGGFLLDALDRMDTVEGHVPPARVLEVMNMVAGYTAQQVQELVQKAIKDRAEHEEALTRIKTEREQEEVGA